MVKKVGNLIPNTFLLQKEVANQTWRNTLVLTTWLFMTPVSLILIS